MDVGLARNDDIIIFSLSTGSIHPLMRLYTIMHSLVHSLVLSLHARFQNVVTDEIAKIIIITITNHALA